MQTQAADRQAQLAATQTRIASEQNEREGRAFGLTFPHYQQRLEHGLPWLNAALDYESGTLSRAYQPLYARTARNYSQAGVPSGAYEAAIRDIDQRKARDYDDRLLGLLREEEAAKSSAAAGLSGQQQLAINYGLGASNSAAGANQSIMQAPLQSTSPFGAIMGAVTGLGSAAISKIPF